MKTFCSWNHVDGGLVQTILNAWRPRFICLLLLGLLRPLAQGVPGVSAGGRGAWDTTTPWSQGPLAGADDDAVFGARLAGDLAHSSGTPTSGSAGRAFSPLSLEASNAAIAWITRTSPTRRAVCVATNLTLTATFNGAMNPATINADSFLVRDSSNHLVAGAVAYLEPDLTATFTPALPLAPGSWYRATITANVTDVSGNGMVADYSWFFTTMESALTDRWLADDLNHLNDGEAIETWSSAGGHPVSATGSDRPQLKKAVTPAGGSVVRFDSSFMTSGPGTSPLGGASAFSVALVFKPSAAGASGPNWYHCGGLVDAEQPGVTLDWGIAFDGLGRVAIGTGQPDTTTFSSGPSLLDGYFHAVLFTWGGGAQSVYVDQQPAVTQTGAATAARMDAGFAFGGILTGEGGPARRFMGDLVEVRFYRASLSAPAAANVMRELTDQHLTPSPAWIVGTSPLNGASSVPANTPLSVTFDRPMNPATITADSFLVQDHANHIVAGTIAYDSSSFTATFTPILPLASNNIYRATISTNVKDLSGASLPGDWSWRFATAEDAVSITVDTTIDSANTNYDGRTLFVANSTLTLNGVHAFKSVFLTDSASLVFQGATIRGGVLSTANGASLSVQSGTLDGVTVNGVLDVGNTYSGSLLTVANGLVLNGTALVGNPTNENYGSIRFNGSQSLSGSGAVVFGMHGGGYCNPCCGSGVGSANALWLGSGNTTLTIGPAITVRGHSGMVGAYAACPWNGPANVGIINQGTIWADVVGGVLTLQGAWTQASAGTYGGFGGTIQISGVLDNTGQTITLAGTANALTLTAGGTIRGGTLAMTDGRQLIAKGDGGVLEGVVVNGVLDIGNTYGGSVLTVANGLVLNGTALVGNPTNENYGSIRFNGSQSLSGNGAVVFGMHGGGYCNPCCGSGVGSANALWLGSGNTTLTIGPAITVRGHNGMVGAYAACPWNGPANVGIINQGTISADVSGGTIVVNAQPLTNLGLLASPAGTLLQQGTISAGGLGALRSGAGAVVLSGVLTNTGQTVLLSGLTNTLTVQGGTIVGGTVVAGNGASLVVVGSLTLDGVTVNGVLDVGNTYSGSLLTVTNGLVLNGTALVGNPTNNNYGSIRFDGSQSLSGNGAVVFGMHGGGYCNPCCGSGVGSANALWLGSGNTTLTIGPAITVRGHSGMVGAYAACPWNGPANVGIINQGTIWADVVGV